MRISYSIAAAWWAGRKDEAIAMINGEELTYEARRERAFGYGSGAHTAWEMEAKKTGRLPAIFGNQDVRVLGTELKLYKQLRPGDYLVGKIDWLGWHEKYKFLIIGDHKTGMSNDGWQVPVYDLLTRDNLPVINFLTAQGIRKKKQNPSQFWYTSMNKLDGSTAIDIVKLTYPETKEEWELPEATTYTKGYNWIMTVLDDIKNDLGIK